MNILFVLYGGLGTNSAVPLMTHAQHLRHIGHSCAVAVPAGNNECKLPYLRVVPYNFALANPTGIFPDERPADIVHAWTPREGVRRFVTKYLAKRPTPWVVYLEDNESWIGAASLAMVGLGCDVLLQHTEEVISAWTPDGMPHPLRHQAFVGLADAAIVIQGNLANEVPPWVPCTTVMPGVDLRSFFPRHPNAELRSRFGVASDERIIVYPGGLNDFVRPGIEALCIAVGLINRQGIPCRLLRSGPVALDFLHRLPNDTAAKVTDLGELSRDELPGLLGLADVLVQPGKPDPFEDLRLPGKLPEFFAMGIPVVLPNASIASLIRDGVDAVIHRTGEPEELASKCLWLFADPSRAAAIGQAGRRFAELHFDPAKQALRLSEAYGRAIAAFDAPLASLLWAADADELNATTLLAKKLRLLSDTGSCYGDMLRAYAACLEFGMQRAGGLEAGIHIRDRELASLKASRESLQAQVQMGCSKIAGLDAELASVRTALEHLRELQTELHAQVNGLHEMLLHRDHVLNAMRASVSWRLTSPLRRIGSFLLRLHKGPRHRS